MVCLRPSLTSPKRRDEDKPMLQRLRGEKHAGNDIGNKSGWRNNTSNFPKPCRHCDMYGQKSRGSGAFPRVRYILCWDNGVIPSPPLRLISADYRALPGGCPNPFNSSAPGVFFVEWKAAEYKLCHISKKNCPTLLNRGRDRKDEKILFFLDVASVDNPPPWGPFGVGPWSQERGGG